MNYQVLHLLVNWSGPPYCFLREECGMNIKEEPNKGPEQISNAKAALSLNPKGTV